MKRMCEMESIEETPLVPSLARFPDVFKRKVSLTRVVFLTINVIDCSLNILLQVLDAYCIYYAIVTLFFLLVLSHRSWFAILSLLT